MAVMLAVVGVARGAGAAEVQPRDSALASRLAASPLVKKLNRIAILLAGEQSGAALEARANVATAFAATGHETVVVAVPVAEHPNRALLSHILAERSTDAVAVVRISTAGGLEALSVVLYGAGGEPLFEYESEASTGTAPAPAPAPPLGPPLRVSRELLLLPGDAAFYDAVGRPDLAARFNSRQRVKRAVQITGGATLLVGVVWGLLDLVATTTVDTLAFGGCLVTAGSGNPPAQSSSDPCAPRSASGIPWAVAAVGLGALVIPLFISSDPLTAAERRSLLPGSADGEVHPPRAPVLNLGFVPEASGGGVVLTGRF